MPSESNSRTSPLTEATLERQWQVAQAAFQDFQAAPNAARSAALGCLFQQMTPILEHAIRSVALRHFLLLPLEMALARLFARTVRRPQLPKSRLMFQLWVESSLLRALADPKDALGVTNGASGEPCGLLQARFNRLQQKDRALLFLYLVEHCSVAEVVQDTGIPEKRVNQDLRRIWARLQEGSPVPIPSTWRGPDFGSESCVAERP